MFEGWWLGGTLGGATVNYDFAPVKGGSVDTSGLLGGVIGGWSWQNGPFVIGVEADLLAADVSGSRRFNSGLNRISPSIDSMADLRLRAGYTVTPELLLFGTFGGAWANAELPIAGPGGGLQGRRLLRLEHRRRRGSRAHAELACALRLPVHRFRRRDGELSWRPLRPSIPTRAPIADR